jgi:hypothetical protein
MEVNSFWKDTVKKRFLFMVCIVIAVGNIFADIPQEERRKNKILYVGGTFGLGPIIGSDGTVLGGNLSPLNIDWQMNRFLSLGSGLNFYFAPQSRYAAPKQTDPNSGIWETYNGMETHILFPLLLQFTHRPGIFSFEIGGGLYIAPVVMNTTVERTNDNGYTVSEGCGKNLFSAVNNNPFGFIVTGSTGIKTGQGILFLNLRYLRDFSEITVRFKDEEIGSHLWQMFGINVGYKFGFFSK